MLVRRAVTSARHSVLKTRINPLECKHFSSSAPKRAEIEITIDGKKVKIEQGAALIQACEKAGVQIPRYFIWNCDGY